MDLKFNKSLLKGKIELPDSKSYSHRIIILAMLSFKKTVLSHMLICDDTIATLESFKALGAKYEINQDSITIDSTQLFCGKNDVLPVNASASTLRFLIPICLAFYEEIEIEMAPSLAKRPLTIYEKIFDIQKDGQHLVVSGVLEPKRYYVNGMQSSQYISGLLMALPLLEHDSELNIEQDVVSLGYIDMTVECLKYAGIEIRKYDERHYYIKGNQVYSLDSYPTQKDISSAGFLTVANYLGQEIEYNTGMFKNQKDDIIFDVLEKCGNESMEIDVTHCPDVVPIMSLALALSPYEYKIVGASRLETKESNRLQSTCSVLNQMGANVSIIEDGLLIKGVKKLHGAVVDSHDDHRIAMMIGIAATVSEGITVLRNAGCVSKSWPEFFDLLKEIGGDIHEL